MSDDTLSAHFFVQRGLNSPADAEGRILELEEVLRVIAQDIGSSHAAEKARAVLGLSLPEPGSRTHYTFTITAREKQAVERFVGVRMVAGDAALSWEVLRKIAEVVDS